MTKKEVVKLLVLIEAAYSKFILKDETVLHWLKNCAEMDYEKVLVKLKNHIKKSPFPPVVTDIAVFIEKSFPEKIKEGLATIEREHNTAKPMPIPLPDWLEEYSIRKSV